MAARLADVCAVSAVAAVVTLVLAAPVARAPSQRIFGHPIVGRHHDPFTVMAQFARPIALGGFVQPVTDIPGALLARRTDPVTAYNIVVLLSFPLSAAAAYLLARHLALSPAGASLAAMAYAFSPFHLAQAAYHPHIAQTHWLPLYLLALWRCLDRASPARLAGLAAAGAAVALSNFYGGFIAAVLTPAAVAAYGMPGDRQQARRLYVTCAALVLIAASGAAYAWSAAGAVAADRSALAFPREDLVRYGAMWWSYLAPPAGHPLLGAASRDLWSAAQVREGLLEQQLGLGLGIVALALVAVVRWAIGDRQPASLARVPVLAIVGVWALVCSLSPTLLTVGTFTIPAPSAVLHELLPMFRSYARFGVVVQLMAALLAGIGLEYLRRSATWRARIAAVALVTLVAGEYVVTPSTQWRDVLPTAAHRWAVGQPPDVRVLDCTPLTRESASVHWLTAGRVRMAGASGDCAAPHLAASLAATGFTHLLVRRGDADGHAFAGRTPDGLRAAARFDDAEVFAVMARAPEIVTVAMTGLSPRERNAEWTWRWMGEAAAWTVVNTGATPMVATLALELSSFQRPRSVQVQFDTHEVVTLEVEPARRIYEVGPFTVPPGGHALVFRAIAPPTVADEVLRNGDARPLSCAFGAWRWDLRDGRP